MNFTEAIASGFSNYVNFSDRSPRSAYWYWTLFAVLVSIVASFIDALLFSNLQLGADVQLSPLNTLTSLVLLLPGLAVSVRRLHDLDRTGWWLLILLTIIGAILLIVWFCMKGTEGGNRYGPDPLAGT
jgi:uncharacterized membrane protein YhaH (DUF805 family)